MDLEVPCECAISFLLRAVVDDNRLLALIEEKGLHTRTMKSRKKQIGGGREFLTKGSSV